MGTNTHDIWNYVNSVDKKTYTIDHYPVTYVWARCAIVCFKSAKSLDVIMDTTPVLRGVNLHWFRLGFSKCAKYRKMGHTLLGCFVDGNFSPGKSPHRVLSDNQVGDIVMGENSSVATSGKAAALLESFSSPNMIKFENMLEGFSTSVLSLSAYFDSLVLTEFFEAGVAIIMNNSLVHHVSKIDEIPDWIILVCLLFKGKFLVMVLDLYASTFSGIRFGQTIEVNSFVAKALNSSIFVVLDGNFNKDNSKKSASFRFCLDLGLANSFGTHLLVRAPTWSNSRGAEKTIDYIFVSDNLSLAVVGQIVASVSDYFNTDHKTVMVLVDLSGLLDVHLNGLRKQANKD
ncbi:hypothetical protein G9A89_017666 [Geosiphon pyriformis]|nr:hypothetical protein G9A89_017666 [Geosiphon pyriformis]